MYQNPPTTNDQTVADPAKPHHAFVVTGRFVADHARDRLFEFGWEDALRFMTAAIPEMTYEQVKEICAGLKTLTGDSQTGLELADEDPAIRKEVEARHRWLFAGVLYDRPSKKYWRPYAFITSWGERDMQPNRVGNRYHPHPAGKMTSVITGGDMPAWGRFRCVRYMDDAVEDRMWHAQIPVGEYRGDQSVLFREVVSPPPWWLHLTDPRLAVVEYVRAGLTLDERGASKEYVEDKKFREMMAKTEDDPMPKKKKKEPEPEKGPTPTPGLVDQILDSLGLEDHVVDGLKRHFTDTGEYEIPEPTRDPSKAMWAWVDREGRFWPCRGYMDHIPLADALCRQKAKGIDLGATKGNASRPWRLPGGPRWASTT